MVTSRRLWYQSPAQSEQTRLRRSPLSMMIERATRWSSHRPKTPSIHVPEKTRGRRIFMQMATRFLRSYGLVRSIAHQGRRLFARKGSSMRISRGISRKARLQNPRNEANRQNGSERAGVTNCENEANCQFDSDREARIDETNPTGRGNPRPTAPNRRNEPRSGRNSGVCPFKTDETNPGLDHLMHHRSQALTEID